MDDVDTPGLLSSHCRGKAQRRRAGAALPVSAGGAITGSAPTRPPRLATSLGMRKEFWRRENDHGYADSTR